MPLTRRKVLIMAGAVVVPAAAFAALYRPFPSDRTPEGAYMRIARGVARDDPKSFFAYLETEAQWACYTIRDFRRKARDRVAATYPEPQRSELLEAYGPYADCPDGSDVFALVYRARGWARRLRKDLSGPAQIDIDPAGERASVVTVRGTRWPFRKRDNGIWGLTVFTAELVAESEKAMRDFAVVDSAAADYERLKNAAR